MYKYELKKIINNSFFFISLVLILMLFFYIIVSYQNDVSYKDNQKFYRSISKTASEQLVTELSEKSNSVMEKAFDENNNTQKGEYGETLMYDFVLLSNATKQCNYVLNDFRNERIELINDFHKKEKISAANNKKYEQAYYKKAAEIYNNVVTPEIIDSDAVDEYIELFHGYSFGNFNGLFLILWTAFITVNCLVSERNFKTANVVYSCKNGRRRLYFNKIAALTTVLFFVSLIFFFTEILVGIFKFRISDYFFAPIQSSENYKMCMYDMNIFECIVTMNLMRFYAMMFTVFTTSFFCIKAKKILRPTILSFVFLTGLSVTTLHFANETSYKMIQKYNFLKNFSAVSLTEPISFLNSFDYGKLFSSAFNHLFVCVIFNGVISVIFVVVSANLYGKDELPLWKKRP